MHKTILIILFPLIVSADDAFIGSRGGNVFPIIRNEQIRMSKEEIRIKMLRDSCIVTCKFWFTNESNDTISDIYMGFPDYFQNYENNSLALRNFTNKVDGKDVMFKKERQINAQTFDTTLNAFDTTYSTYQFWYCWHIENIKPHAVIKVENSYTGDWGGSADGTCSFSYLIGTAQTWHNNIGSGRIIFDYSDFASDLFIDSSYNYVKPGIGMNKEVYKDSTVFSFRNYYPKWDEQLELTFLPYWFFPFEDNTNPVDCEQFFYEFKNYNRIKLRLMRNEIYARHGFIFKDQDLKDYFENRSWYKPDSLFSIKKFSHSEVLMANFLKYLETK